MEDECRNINTYLIMLPKEENKKNVRQTIIEEVIAQKFLDLNKKQLRPHGPELRHVVAPNQELP